MEVVTIISRTPECLATMNGKAPARIEALTGGRRDTPEGDRLDLLAIGLAGTHLPTMCRARPTTLTIRPWIERTTIASGNWFIARHRVRAC